MTLYERTGRAPLVVWGEVTDGAHRYAVVRAIETIKCAIPECPAQSFRIAYKLDSFLRRPWQDKIEFATGERTLLFLRKFTKEDGEMPDGDLYTLMWGAQGKATLPAEGEEAHVGAARFFARVLTEKDPDNQAGLLKSALSDKNPYIADTSFDEMTRQGLGDLAMVPDLIRFFEHTREPIRRGALGLLGQIIGDSVSAGRQLSDSIDLPALTDRLRALAIADASPEVRVEAVRVLGKLGGEDVRAFLKRVAKEDASQLVRYEAEKTLLDLGPPP